MSCFLFDFAPFNCCRKFVQGEIKVACLDGGTRALKSYVEWKDNCINGEHLWVYTGSSSEACYVGEVECSKQGPRLCCSACKIAAHTGCIGILTDKIKFLCRQTFKDLSVANLKQLKEIEQQNTVHHHWVHKKNHKGRCKHCTKTFGNAKLPFSSKEIQAITCSWCKVSYHNKENCYTLADLTEQCSLGAHKESIISPTWIIRMPLNLSNISQSQSGEYDSNLYQTFKVVPHQMPGMPNVGTKPVLVFVNPRSGGSQVAKMMQKFNWLLNPRQVFDLIQTGGPRPAIELYKDVPNLRILTIGGDGTASWILSCLDDAQVANRIPVAVLPLGTGNDLARALGWGNSYTDEPVAKILAQVRDGEIVKLDRWNLHVERNDDCITSSSHNENYKTFDNDQSSSLSRSLSMGISSMDTDSLSPINDPSGCDTNNESNNNSSNKQTIQQQPLKSPSPSPYLQELGSSRLPMDIINNYFSLGVDAHIALEFHNAREAHPERFSSRLRNRMFYGQAGGKDLLKRKWKDLSNFVELYCDGQDLTPRLKELRVHSVLFLNIPSYGGGTRPWPTANTTFLRPRTDDGLIEVIGLTTYQLPLLQAGGHGTCIAQCRSAKIVTTRTIPMQVDGEPCNLLPSIITINFRNRVCMLAKSKSSSKQANNI